MTQGTLAPPAWLNRGVLLRSSPASEHQLIRHVLAYCLAQQYELPALLVIDYLVAIKSSPFVLLFGPRGQGKTELVRLFAQALTAPFDDQYTYVNCGVQFDQTAVQFQDRFSWIKFNETLETAANPANTGKLFFLCLDRLRFSDVAAYFAKTVRGADGHLRLVMRGYPADRWTILPPNVIITGTLDADDLHAPQQSSALAHVNCVYVHKQWLPQPRHQRIIPRSIAPIGYQTALLDHALRTDEAVHGRIESLLGSHGDDVLQPPVELVSMLWQAHLTYDDAWRSAMLRTVANSFTMDGRGLFIQHNTVQNAQFAYTFAMARQMLLRLWGHQHYEQQLEHVLHTLLDTMLLSTLTDINGVSWNEADHA